MIFMRSGLLTLLKSWILKLNIVRLKKKKVFFKKHIQELDCFGEVRKAISVFINYKTRLFWDTKGAVLLYMYSSLTWDWCGPFKINRNHLYVLAQ